MKTFSAETRRRMSESAKRRCESAAFRAQVTTYWQPFCSADALRSDYIDHQMSQQEIASKYGVTLKRVQTSMRRYAITPRRPIKRNQRGPANPAWRGAAASYTALHKRVEAARGCPKQCDDCGVADPSKTFDWANISGHYADITDYRRLCRHCHHILDGKVRNLGAYARRKEVMPDA